MAQMSHRIKCAYKFCVYITCVRDVFCTKYHVIKIFPTLFAHGLKVRCVYIVRRRENVCVCVCVKIDDFYTE